MTSNKTFPRIALAILLGFAPLAQAQVSVRIGELTKDTSVQDEVDFSEKNIGPSKDRQYVAMASASDDNATKAKKNRPVRVASNDTPVETRQMVALREKEEKKRQNYIALNGTPAEKAKLVALREKEKKEMVALNDASKKREEVALAKP